MLLDLLNSNALGGVSNQDVGDEVATIERNGHGGREVVVHLKNAIKDLLEAISAVWRIVRALKGILAEEHDVQHDARRPYIHHCAIIVPPI